MEAKEESVIEEYIARKSSQGNRKVNRKSDKKIERTTMLCLNMIFILLNQLIN